MFRQAPDQVIAAYLRPSDRESQWGGRREQNHKENLGGQNNRSLLGVRKKRVKMRKKARS